MAEGPESKSTLAPTNADRVIMVRREYYEKKVSHKGVAIDSYWMKNKKQITRPSHEGAFTVCEEKGWTVPPPSRSRLPCTPSRFRVYVVRDILGYGTVGGNGPKS